jgi:hypothetical protein
MRACVIFALCCCLPRIVSAEEPAVPIAGFAELARPFLEKNCLSCHGPEQAKAGFRIDRLKGDFTAPLVAEQWKEVMDRVNAGEMPPEDSPRSDAREAAAFAEWIHRQLKDVERIAKEAGGRVPMRRLNRDEFANTVRDLLLLDERLVRPLIEELPADGTAEGFDRLGAALFFDQAQVERTLAVSEKIAARAIVTAQPKQNRQVNKFEFVRLRPPPDMVEVFPAFEHKIPRGAKDTFIHDKFIEYIQGYPTYRREDLGWGSIQHFAVVQTVTEDGYYRVRVKAMVDNRGRTEKNRFRFQYAMESPIQVDVEVPVDPSGVTEAEVFLRGPVNGEVKGPQVFRLLWNHTEKSVIREPKYMAEVSKWTALRGQMEQAAAKRAPEAEMAALRKKRSELEAVLNAWEGPANIYNPDMDVEKLPRLQIESIEIEGPVQREWPLTSHKAILFDGDQRRDDAYVSEIFAKLLPRAYRRPVTRGEIDAAVAVVNDAERAGGLSFLEAMRVGVQRVICSPGFLFLGGVAEGERGPLSDHELAARLSYFLWSTMPDDTLLRLADAGKLKDPETVAAQVRRMLADPKCGQFVQNFAGQWLSVRDYGAVQPAAEYRNYDKLLEQAAREEPLAFFAEVLHQNLPVTSFLDSNFVVVNERLAKHYGLKDVTGSEFRRVDIRPEDHRGGVLGMAGLMTYLADGTRTLPMRRGSWVLREILGDPPNNPPPNAGEIQPNTSGKNLTVRQRLELHRRDEICASCHTKLDPYGLALENYDAIGQWRERFNGEGFRGSNGPLLDVSGTLAGGKDFTTLEGYKTRLMEQKDRFARSFSIKMLTYALGRPVGYADHEAVDVLTSALKNDDYRIQALIQAIAASPPFRAR